jgi:hypothetical protein
MRMPCATAFGLRQIAARAFLLNEESPFPEKVDEAGSFGAGAFYRFLERSNLAAQNAEDVEEFVVKFLRFALLVMSILPILGECSSPNSYFIPRKPHAPPLRSSTARCTTKRHRTINGNPIFANKLSPSRTVPVDSLIMAKVPTGWSRGDPSWLSRHTGVSGFRLFARAP